MKTRIQVAATAALLSAATGARARDFSRDFTTELHALKQVREGRETFRYATFGDEAFWGDGIGLHEAIAGAANGGVGPGVSPEHGARRRTEGGRRGAAALAAAGARARRGRISRIRRPRSNC